MPSTKTDTAIRYPESDIQKRRLRDTTQNRKWAARMEEQRRTASAASAATAWPVEQLLQASMDGEGNPVPDPAQFGDGAKARRTSGVQKGGGDQDMVGAVNDEAPAW
jgi:hypothetical protein